MEVALFFSFSYSFELNPNWSKAFSGQEEIRCYLQDVADKYGITQLIEFGKAVNTTVWNKENDEWIVTLDNGEVIYCVKRHSVLDLVVAHLMKSSSGGVLF